MGRTAQPPRCPSLTCGFDPVSWLFRWKRDSGGKERTASQQVELRAPEGLALDSFSFPTCPSVCPLLHGMVGAAFTPAPSCRSPAAKVVTAATPLRDASASQPSNVVSGARHGALLPVQQLRGRTANRRT
jgi:hypothetical protein